MLCSAFLSAAERKTKTDQCEKHLNLCTFASPQKEMSRFEKVPKIRLSYRSCPKALDTSLTNYVL